MYQKLQKVPSKIAWHRYEAWIHCCWNHFAIQQRYFPHSLPYRWKKKNPLLFRYFGTTMVTAGSSQKPQNPTEVEDSKLREEVFRIMKTKEIKSSDQFLKLLSKAATAKLKASESEEFRAFLSTTNAKFLRSNAEDLEHREISVKLFKLLAAVDYHWHLLSGVEKSAFLALTSRHQDSFFQSFQTLSLFAQWPEAWQSLSEFMQNRFLQRLKEHARIELAAIGRSNSELTPLTFSRRYGLLPSYFSQLGIRLNRIEDPVELFFQIFAMLLSDTTFSKWLPPKLQAIVVALLDLGLQAHQLPEELQKNLLSAMGLIMVQTEARLSSYPQLQRLLARLFSTSRDLLSLEMRAAIYPNTSSSSPPPSSSSVKAITSSASAATSNNTATAAVTTAPLLFPSLEKRIETATTSSHHPKPLTDSEVMALLQSMDHMELNWKENPQLIALAATLRQRLQQLSPHQTDANHLLKLTKRLFILSGQMGNDWSRLGHEGQLAFQAVVQRLIALPTIDELLECLRMIQAVPGAWRGLPDDFRRVILERIEEVGQFSPSRNTSNHSNSSNTNNNNSNSHNSPLSITLQEQLFSSLLSFTQRAEVIDQPSLQMLLSIARSIAQTSYLLKPELNPTQRRQRAMAQALQQLVDFHIPYQQIPSGFTETLYTVIRGDLSLTTELREIYSLCQELFHHQYHLLPADIETAIAEESPASRSGFDVQILSVSNCYQLIVVLEGAAESHHTWQKMTLREQLQLRRKIESLLTTNEKENESNDVFVLGNLLISLAELQMPFSLFPVIFQRATFTTVVGLVEQANSFQEVKTILFMCERLGLQWSHFPASSQLQLQQLFYQQINALFPLASASSASSPAIIKTTALSAETVKTVYSDLLDLLEMYEMIRFDWQQSKKVFSAINAILVFPFKVNRFPSEAMEELARVLEVFERVGLTWGDLFLSLQSKLVMFMKSQSERSPALDRLCVSVVALQSHQSKPPEAAIATTTTPPASSSSLSEVYQEIKQSLEKKENRDRHLDLLPFFLKTLSSKGVTWSQLPSDLRQVLLQSLEAHFEQQTSSPALSLAVVEQYITSLSELNVPWSDFPANVRMMIETTIHETK